MKLNKKSMIAFGMIICCFIMVAPMTASASSSKCPPHYFNKNNKQNSVETKKHSYIYGMMEKEEAVEDYWYQDCTVVINIDQYELECSGCEIKLEQQGLGERRIHNGDF